jgi:hypothetical protein
MTMMIKKPTFFYLKKRRPCFAGASERIVKKDVSIYLWSMKNIYALGLITTSILSYFGLKLKQYGKTFVNKFLLYIS